MTPVTSDMTDPTIIRTVIPMNPIVPGCSYKTSWQKEEGMHFILVETRGGRARLKTKTTNKDFWTSTNDLIFIQSLSNNKKVIKYNQEIILKSGVVPDPSQQIKFPPVQIFPRRKIKK